jgi:hypothetical protein
LWCWQYGVEPVRATSPFFRFRLLKLASAGERGRIFQSINSLRDRDDSPSRKNYKNELATALESKDLGSGRANIQTALKYIEMVLSAREAQNEVDQRIAPS